VLKQVLNRSVMVVAALCLSLAWAGAATAKEGTAHSVVEQVTKDLMAVVESEKKLLQTDPDAYYDKVKAVLEPVVDFGFIARNVMGPYWESASAEQRRQFVETFKNSLVETYAKGMANYSDLKIRVLPPEGGASDERRVSVIQEVTGPDGTNRVAYTMAQNREGEWKLINMVLNGVNLGKTFRNQFAQAAKQRDGNLDAVISNWSADA
jgi:phospholipid transport system substrate-binding protein